MGLRKSFKPTNALPNGNFSKGLTGWNAVNAGSPAVANNICTFTAVAQNGYVGQYPAFAGSHKYYFKVDIKLASATISVSLQTKDAGWHTVMASASTTAWQKLSGVLTSSSGDIAAGAGRFIVNDGRVSGWDAIQTKESMMIDLTACGVPASVLALSDANLKAWCDANIPAWFDGTLSGGSFGGIGGLR